MNHVVLRSTLPKRACCEIMKIYVRVVATLKHTYMCVCVCRGNRIKRMAFVLLLQLVSE